MAPHRFKIKSLLMPNPANGKRVTRPSRWGNPFRVGHEATDAAEAVAMFREHLKDQPDLVAKAQRELRGFHLGCTCPLDQPCHAGVWLGVANWQPLSNPSPDQ